MVGNSFLYSWNIGKVDKICISNILKKVMQRPKRSPSATVKHTAVRTLIGHSRAEFSSMSC